MTGLLPSGLGSPSTAGAGGHEDAQALGSRITGAKGTAHDHVRNVRYATCNKICSSIQSDLSANCFQGFLKLVCLFLGGVFLEDLRQALNELLGLKRGDIRCED
jgi:hypothetical protein